VGRGTVAIWANGSLASCIYAESAWTWLAPLLAVTVVVPFAARVIHKFWVRPIIQVRLDDQADCHGRTPLVSLRDGKVVAQVMYLRLRIQNRGRTTIKDCLGNWVRIRVWSAGKIFDFAHEVISRGWAHHPESKQRNIPRGEAYYLDVATLLLSEDQKHNTLWWPDPIPPTNMMEFLHSLPPGKATYLFEIRVNADNARPRTVPVQFVFDPARSKLSFIPFNTRYPGWRWRWWWRARRDR
jgi:hypothetical protein